MRSSRLIVLLTLVALATGCAWLTEYGRREGSAKEALERGHYDEAVSEAVASLVDKPDHAAAREILEKALPAAVARHGSRAEAAKGAGDWERAVAEYQALVNLAHVVGRIPGQMRMSQGSPYGLTPASYEADLTSAKQKAADQYYQRGLEALSLPGIKAQRRAANRFARVAAFVPEYKDAAALYARARKAGTERVAILPFRDRTDSGLALYLEGAVLADVKADPQAMEFVEITGPGRFEALGWRRDLVFAGLLSPEQLRPLQDSVDKAVYVRVLQDKVSISPIGLDGPFKAETTVRNYQQGTSTPVHARYVVKNWQARAQVEIEAHVFDVRNQGADTTRRFSGETREAYSWAEMLDGDKRAMEEDSRVGKTLPRNPPDPDDLRRSASEEVRRHLAIWLQDRFRESE